MDNSEGMTVAVAVEKPAPGQGVHWERLDAALLGERLGEGRTAEVFRLRSGEVVKLYRHSLAKKRAARELANSQWAAQAGLPVWQASHLVYCNRRWGIVGARLPAKAVSLSSVLLRRPWEAERWFQAFLDLHTRINAASAVGLPPVKRLLGRRIRSDKLPSPEREAVLAHLRTLPVGRFLCHGDLHPANVLVTPEGLLAVDWCSAGRGAVAFDIARTNFLLGDGLRPQGGFGWLVRALGQRYARRYRERRLAEAGISQEKLEAWRLPVLAARLVRRDDDDRERLFGLLQAEIKRLGLEKPDNF